MKNKKKIILSSSIIAGTLSLLYILNKLVYILNIKNTNNYNKNNLYYEWRFGKIKYTKKGEGKPILLIHSLFSGSSSSEFNLLGKSLSKTNTVYTLDLLGYGKSDKPNITYTAYLYVQMLSDFIKDIIEEPVNIITSGDSNSYISMLYLQDKNYINKMIFINPVDISKISKSTSSKDKLIKQVIDLPLIGTFIYNLIQTQPLIKKRLESYYYNKSFITDNILHEFYNNIHDKNTQSRFAFSSQYCKYNNMNIESSIKTIDHSTLIIQGSDVERNIDKIYCDYKNLNSSIEYVMINNTKEFPHIENLQKTIDAINYFL